MLVPICFFPGVLVVFTSMPFAALEAASVKLSWDPSPDVPVAGYAIYYGTTSHMYTDKISLGEATAVTISRIWWREPLIISQPRRTMMTDWKARSPMKRCMRFHRIH